MAVSSVSSSSIAMTGLFSNLDTDSIINAIMASDKNSYTKLENRKADYEAQQGLFRTLNTKLSALKSAAFDLSLSTSLSQTTAASSNSTVVSTTTGSGAIPGSYQIHVDQLATALTIKSDPSTMSDKDLGAALQSLSGKTITINGASVTLGDFDGTMSNSDVLASIKKSINGATYSDSSQKVVASSVQTSDTESSLVLTAGQTGAGNTISFGSDSDSVTLAKTLGWYDSSGALNTSNIVQNGQNASFTVNGVSIESSSNVVSTAIEGVTLNLSDEGDSTINISTDTDKVADTVDAFVTAYNDVIDAVNSTKDYTDSNGRKVLQTDSTLTNLQDQLNSWINAGAGQPEDGSNSSLSLQYLYQIGLEIDKGATTSEQMTGKLAFDKDKFADALKTDPDGVYKLFAFNGDGTSSDGIFKAINANLSDWTNFTSGTVKMKIDGYDSEISFISDEMEQAQTRLDLKEASLKQKYANMETSLSSLQNTQTWLTQQVNSMLG